MGSGATHISPVVLRQEVGRRIRLARQAAGYTIVAAADRLEITRSALSRFENGVGTVNVHLARSMMNVYDQRMDWINNQLEVRLIRQERLTDEEHPLRLDAVVHEIALRSPAARPAVMQRQLRHLALINELPNCVPAGVAHLGFLVRGDLRRFQHPGLSDARATQHVPCPSRSWR